MKTAEHVPADTIEPAGIPYSPARRHRRASRPARPGALRLSSLTQTPIPTGKPASVLKSTRPWDTVPRRDARQWFAHLRPHLLASRVVTSVIDEGTKKERITGSHYTFQNIIDENGQHV